MTVSYFETAISDTRQGETFMFTLKTRLKLAGWTVVASGDGVGLSSNSGDVITHAGSGANGMKNTNAWFVIQQPSGGSGNYAGTRQLMIQGGAAGGFGTEVWRAYMSPGGTADSSGITEDIPSDFTDGGYLVGSGTPASPTYATITHGGGGAGVIAIGVGDAADNFGFWMMVTDGVLTRESTFVFMDPLDLVTPGETDPFVYCVNRPPGTTGLEWDDIDNHEIARAQFGNDGAINTASMLGFPGDFNINHMTTKDDLVRMYYGRGIVPGGFKGVSQFFRWRTVSRAMKSTYTVDSSKDRISYHDVVIRWGGTVPL